MTCQAEKSFFFGKKTTCLSTFRISHISHFRKSSRSKDWMGSISSSPICWFFQHLKHLNSTISCSPCPALIYRPRLHWMGISANYPCLSTHFVLWYLFIYIQVYTILIYLSRYTQYLFITIVRYHSLLEFVKRKDHCFIVHHKKN